MRSHEEILSEYTLSTDKVENKGIRFTDKLNYFVYEVTREGEVHELLIAPIVAAGQVVKIHNRALVKTALPNLIEKAKTDKKEARIKELQQLMDTAKVKGYKAQYQVYKKEYLKLCC